MFLESASSVQSPYMASRQRKAQLQQNSQLAKMKARVASVLKRTEIRRKQNEAAAASRGASSREKERAPRDDEITAPMISLVLEDGSVDGIHPLSRVLAKMDRKLMTLVMVNPNQDPPVCRIYSRKLLYERERQIKKKQNVSVKNSKPQRIVMTCGIDSHDLEIKLKKAADMLAKGRRVTVVVELRQGYKGYDAREKLGAQVMAGLEDKCSVVSPPIIEGRTWMVVLHGKSLG
ncbi:hypothetical protein GGI23_000361 [Coemansia sp. RSA 2559]|nr:hypothetical protein GGI23_000361 [Coemansia sp. RSA 2559]